MQRLGEAIAAHVGRAVVGRLLVDEQDEPQTLVGERHVLQQTRELEHRGRAAAVVVGAGGIVGRIVMGADDEARRCRGGAGRRQLDGDVAHRLAADVVDLRLRLIAERFQLALDVGGGTLQLGVVRDVVRHAGDGFDVAPQPLRQDRSSTAVTGGVGPAYGSPGRLSEYQYAAARAAISRASSPATNRATILITRMSR